MTAKEVESEQTGAAEPLTEAYLKRAVLRSIEIDAQRRFPVWMVGDMDGLIDAFIEAQNTHAHLKERTPFGAVLWPSGKAFARAIETELSEEFKNPTAVSLELGCGVGFVAAWLAHLGVGKVVATDYEPAFATFVEKNAREFFVENQVHFKILDWTQPLPSSEIKQYRLVVACDVLYEDVHIEFLPKIASAVLHPEGVFYLADPERYRFQSALENLNRCFGKIEDTLLEVASDDFDASAGVVNASATLTRVHLLKCTLPRL